MIILLVDSRVHADRSVHRSSHFMQSTNTWWCMVIRGVDRSLDWFFWSHEMTVLESCAIPRWGTWPVDHCAPLSLSITSSLHWRCFMTDICPSFLRRSFCGCLIKFVMELAFNFSVPFGNSMLAILFWWVHLYMLAVIKKSPRIRSNNYIGSCYTHSVVLLKKVILSF